MVQRPDRLRDVWIVVACAAIGGALAEIAVILGARIVLHRYTLLNPKGLWLAPIAMKSVVVDGHHFISGADGAEELYDVLGDPWERTNVLQKPGLGATVERARALVELARARDVRRGHDQPRGAR